MAESSGLSFSNIPTFKKLGETAKKYLETVQNYSKVTDKPVIQSKNESHRLSEITAKGVNQITPEQLQKEQKQFKSAADHLAKLDAATQNKEIQLPGLGDNEDLG